MINLEKNNSNQPTEKQQRTSQNIWHKWKIWNKTAKYAIVLTCAVALVGGAIWIALPPKIKPVELTSKQIDDIMYHYIDSLKQELFDGFYLAPAYTPDTVAYSNDGLYTREEVIDRYFDNDKMAVINSNREVIELPEAQNGIDSVCVANAPFLEYIDRNGLRRAVVLSNNKLYYYAGECGTHNGLAQFIAVSPGGEYGILYHKGAIRENFINDRIVSVSQSSPRKFNGYYIENDGSRQYYDNLGNPTTDPSDPIPSEKPADNAISRYNSDNYNGIFKDMVGRPVAKFEKIDYTWVNGYVKVKSTGGYGIYNYHEKRLVVPTIYEDISIFGSATNMFPAKRNGKWGYVRSGGEEAIGFRFKKAYSFDPDTKLAVVENDSGKCGYIGMDGKFKIDPVLYSADTMRPGGARIMKDTSLYGFIRTDGSLIASWYPYIASQFSLDRLAVCNRENMIGFVNGSNKLVIPYIFDNRNEYIFNDFTYLCKVFYKGVEWYINTNGAFACPVKASPTDQNIARQIQEAEAEAKAEAERKQKEKEERLNKRNASSKISR